MRLSRMLIGFAAMQALFVGIESSRAAEIGPPASGSFWSLRPDIGDRERSLLVDKVSGQTEPRAAYSAETLASLNRSRDPFLTGAGAHQAEYFANPEPSSMLVWATSIMGVVAAGYGFRRRNQ